MLYLESKRNTFKPWRGERINGFAYRPLSSAIGPIASWPRSAGVGGDPRIRIIWGEGRSFPNNSADV